jgi:hypothetical protein
MDEPLILSGLFEWRRWLFVRKTLAGALTALGVQPCDRRPPIWVGSSFCLAQAIVQALATWR